MKRESLVGVGVAGLMLGGLVAVIIAESPSAAQQARPAAAVKMSSTEGQLSGAAPVASAHGVEPPPAAQLTPQERELMDALQEAHRQVHAGEEPPAEDGDGLSKALEDRIKKDSWIRDARTLLHTELGEGAFVQPGALTPLADDLLAYLKRIDEHGLEQQRFRTDALAEKAEAYLARTRGERVSPPAALGAHGPAVMQLLRAPRLVPDKALARLTKAGRPLPGAEAIEQAVTALEQARGGEATLQEAAKLEAAFGWSLLRLVMDYRIVRKAGPNKVTRDETKLVDGRGEQKRLRRILNQIADAPAGDARFRVIEPVHPDYQPLLKAYARYRALAEKSCTRLISTWKFYPTQKGWEVGKLKERLACEGYYDGDTSVGHYDPTLLEAVKRYQRTHDLKDDGHVGGGTIRSLNVPLAERAKQIALALQRLRESYTNDFESPYLRVNVPAFELQMIDEGKVVDRRRVIVGTNKLDDDKVRLIQGHINRTKLFKTRLYEVIVNPDWIMPLRVEKGELKTSIEKDPNYLEKHNIRRVTLDDGTKVFIQGRGRGNVLGKVKFLLEESSAIYLHDTDKRTLFRKQRRDFSHGCIRVRRAIAFGKELLARDGWESKDVDRTFKSSTQRGFKLKRPIPLATEYVTVTVTDEGDPIFLGDIYDYDEAYYAGRAPEAQIRWGHSLLRPRWVPLVPAEVVEGWRRKGKPAPRNYDPAKHGG